MKRYDNLFRLPESIFGAFQENTGWSSNISVSKQLYIVEPGLYYDATFNASLVFQLEGGPTVEIPSYELVQHPRGLDPDGNIVVQSNVTMANVFYQNAPFETATLGKIFLSQACFTL